MTAKVVDGNNLARTKSVELKKLVKKLDKKLVLGIVVFEDDLAGLKYSGLKMKVASNLGIEIKRVVIKFKNQEQVEKKVRELNEDSSVTGLMIQHPGKRWAREKGMADDNFLSWWKKLISLINQSKDVDGLRGDSIFQLGVVKAVMEIIEKYIPSRDGILAVVVGKRGFVGRGLVKTLKENGYTVKGLGRDDDLKGQCSKADILISATGKAGLIRVEMVKEGAIVIDVGWPKAEVEYETVKEKASVITPVPGGVGPLSVVCLLENLVKAGYTSNLNTHIG
jgi:methylenetetrahydrofolate dehydrogenase (NADP+) / methenyltetrahydrofolate cyclohydrolase